MSANTTHRLVADMERLRGQLGIEHWLLCGRSWGSTLALAYAERHPTRVSAIVLRSVTMSRRAEIDWLYRGAARFFPAEWERFRAASGAAGDDGVVRAYARLMESDDPEVRRRAAAEWAAWEDAVVSREPGGAGAYSGREPAALLAFVRICAHYAAHGAWLEDGQLLRDANRLSGIPGVLVHGRLDLSAPLANAWELARAWPDARLVVVDEAGHTGGMTAQVVEALDGFAAARPSS
jgi:proline iminopeptidase